MYTKEEREGILWEFHRSGMGVREACRRLPLFPTRDNLYRWLGMEEAGELAATEMPDRLARTHCAHGEDRPRHTVHWAWPRTCWLRPMRGVVCLCDWRISLSLDEDWHLRHECGGGREVRGGDRDSFDLRLSRSYLPPREAPSIPRGVVRGPLSAHARRPKRCYWSTVVHGSGSDSKAVGDATGISQSVTCRLDLFSVVLFPGLRGGRKRPAFTPSLAWPLRYGPVTAGG